MATKTVTAIIENAPADAFTVQNQNGDTPLSHLIKTIRKRIAIPIGITKAMLKQASKEAFSTKDNDGRTLLHAAFMEGQTGPSIQLKKNDLTAIIEKAPSDAFTKKDKNGHIPMYTALCNKKILAPGESDAIITAIVKKTPLTALREKNEFEETPLTMTLDAYDISAANKVIMIKALPKEAFAGQRKPLLFYDRWKDLLPNVQFAMLEKVPALVLEKSPNMVDGTLLHDLAKDLSGTSEHMLKFLVEKAAEVGALATQDGHNKTVLSLVQELLKSNSSNAKLLTLKELLEKANPLAPNLDKQ